MSTKTPKCRRTELCAVSPNVSQKPKVFGRGSRRSRLSSSIFNLPMEILLKIFSFSNPIEVFFQLSSVCRSWRNIIRDPKMWKKVVLDGKTPVECLPVWLTKLPLLKHLVIKNRRNINKILELVSQNCENLEELELLNCRGSFNNRLIPSRVMCELTKKCQKLRNIRFQGTSFKSWRFLKCVAKNIKKNNINSGCYTGPINTKNLYNLLRKLILNEKNKLVSQENLGAIDMNLLTHVGKILNTPSDPHRNVVLDIDFCIVEKFT